MSGMLYLCATPIGNLGDITGRVLDVLRAADLVAAEDTRNTRKLLTHYDIHTTLVSYHDHNQHERGAELLARVAEGQVVAVVSDAGMPGISDPGFELVRSAIDQGLPFTVLPGASAVLMALVMSGLDISRFAYLGFPPRSRSARKEFISGVSSLPMTLVFYEAPHRLRAFLQDLQDVLGDRQAAVARELTKRYEEVKRGTISELGSWFAEHEPRGEFVVTVAGISPAVETSQLDPHDALKEVAALVSAGEDPSTAIKVVAKRFGLSRRELYNLYHRID